jgi:hypothetical protein
MKPTLLLVPLSVALGFVAGVLSPKAADASGTFDLYIQPGGDSSSMTCGWHGSTGCPNPGGFALDWSSLSGDNVTFRSYGTAVPTSSVGVGYPGDASSTCSRNKVEVRSLADIWRGDVVWTHTNENTYTSFVIYGGDVLSPAFTSVHVADTRPTEIPGCPFSVQHAHQYNSASGSGNTWYHNTNVYPNATNPGNWSQYNMAYWQARTYWTE